MNKFKSGKRRFAYAVAVGFVALIMQGCATKVMTPEASVAVRASERWSLLIGGDFDKAYEYLSPSSRAVLSLDRYKAEFAGAVIWVSGTVVSVKCESEKCDARIRLEAKPVLGPRLGANMGNIVTYFDEPWLQESGQWWFFQKL